MIYTALNWGSTVHTCHLNQSQLCHHQVSRPPPFLQELHQLCLLLIHHWHMDNLFVFLPSEEDSKGYWLPLANAGFSAAPIHFAISVRHHFGHQGDQSGLGHDQGGYL